MKVLQVHLSNAAHNVPLALKRLLRWQLLNQLGIGRTFDICCADWARILVCVFWFVFFLTNEIHNSLFALMKSA